MKLCEDLGVSLSGIPFEGGLKTPTNRLERRKLSARSLQKIAGGARRRLTQSRRTPDLNAAAVAESLVESEAMQNRIAGLLETLGVEDANGRIDWILQNVKSCEREVGFLVSIALLQEHVRSIGRQLDAA